MWNTLAIARRKYAAWALLLPWIASLVSCGGSPPPVVGTVTSAGHPVELADVKFYDKSGAIVGSAKTDTTGAFVTDEGLPVGEYAVSVYRNPEQEIDPFSENATLAAATPEDGSAPIADRYASPFTSGLSHVVAEDETQPLHLTLD